MINAMKISSSDNVVTVIEHIKAGENVEYLDENNKKNNIKAKDDIRIYHKIALKNINKGENIIKYGENIGVAHNDISEGEHVHSHNTDEQRENLEEKE